jgi:hypothetical protein
MWYLINPRKPYFSQVLWNRVRTARKYSTSAAKRRQQKRTTQLLLKSNKVVFLAHAMKTQIGGEIQHHSFLTSAPDGGGERYSIIHS